MGEQKMSETIEVRLGHRQKTEFMAYCQRSGRTASTVLRGLIDIELAPRPIVGPVPWWRRKASFVSGGALTIILIASTIVGPSTRTVAAAPDFRSAFDGFDRNGDGVLDKIEYGTVAASRTNPACRDVAFVIPLARGAVLDNRGMRGFAILRQDLSFDMIDWNRDGQIAFDEYSANWTHVLRKGFAFLDADKDGVLVPAEYERVNSHRFVRGTRLPPTADFNDLDRSGDSLVSWVEFTTENEADHPNR